MFKRFLQNKRGNIIPIVAIAAVPMIAVVGAAVDYSQLARYQGTLQQALDASALATAKQLGTGVTPAALEQFSKDFFFANIDGIPHQSITFTYGANNSATGNLIELAANVDYPIQFLTVLGISEVPISALSEVKTANDSIEIALVLDNSGSMNSNGRLSTAKTAAKKLAQSLFQQTRNSNHATPLKIGVVPFAGTVNIGSSNKSASWMDKEGKSSIHHDNLSWSDNPIATADGTGWKDSSGNWLTRFTLFDDMVSTSWEGCVEARPYPYLVNDATPTSATPDTLIVPLFAPDEPDNYSGYREETPNSGGPAIYCTKWYWYPYHGYCRKWSDGYKGYYHPTEGYANRYSGDYDYYGNYTGSSSGGVTYGSYLSEESYENDYLRDDHNMPAGMLAKSPSTTGSGADQNSRQDWSWKYKNQNPSTPSVGFLAGGPNMGCTTREITPLTASIPGQVISAIANMQASGSTNIQQGISWGWKVLSSGQPFTSGVSENVTDNKKIMIVMTDGNNTYYKGNDFDYSKSNYNKSIYMGFGYSKNGRIFDHYGGAVNPSHTGSTFTSAMNEHMLETCENAKAAGITIYAVAYDVPNGSSVKSNLQSCSSNSSKTGKKLYFDAAGSSQLLATFDTITEDISRLRIAR